MKARINYDCVNYIYEAFVGNHMKHEIGGILLGLRTDEEIIATKAVSILSAKECSYSYSLDGCKATDIVNSSDYDFVGIWHSHINSYDHFTKTDEMVNKGFAKTFDGIISILVVADNDDYTRVLPCFVNNEGKCEHCYELFAST